MCSGQLLTAVLPNACILWYFGISADFRTFNIADDRHWARPQNVMYYLEKPKVQLTKHTKDIFTIDNFWTKQECQDFIFKSETIGYEPATVTTESGQKLVTKIRNNNRVIFNNNSLAVKIWQKLKSFAPAQFGNSKAIGLNELFRFYKYQVGQQFKKHRDQSFIRDNIEASYFTFMIYLNDNYEGGETTFNDLTIQPKQGTALIFQHDLEHEGSSVKQGIKYVLRTDIMYRLDE